MKPPFIELVDTQTLSCLCVCIF